MIFCDTLMKFTKEYQFPHFKFLGKHWTKNNEANKKNFLEMVVQFHLPVPSPA